MLKLGVHGFLGKIAYDNLPDWERKLWQKWSNDIPMLCSMPDAYYSDKKRIGKYIILPDGHLMPHGPTDDKWRICFECEGQSREIARYVISYYLQQIISLMQDEEWEESLRFSGAFAHYLQDSSSPGHGTNNYLIAELMPFPKGKYYFPHKILEDGSSFNENLFIKTVALDLLGGNIEDAVFNIENKLQQIIRHARSVIVPTVLAFYQGDSKSYVQGLAKAANLSTSLLASAWHTCFSIAGHKCKGAKIKKEVRLTDLIPDAYYSQPPYFIYVPEIVTDAKGNALPIRMFCGKTKRPELMNNAIAVYGASLVAYSIPKGIYKSFSAIIGLDAGNSPDSSVGFRIAVERTGAERIEIDPNGHEIKDKYAKKWIPFSEWVNPKYVIFDSGIIRGYKSVKKITVQLPECERLILITYRPDDKKAHAVWGEGRLIK